MTPDCERARSHLETLCAVQPDRRPGSAGNNAAVQYAAQAIQDFGWEVDRRAFEVVDWWSGGASLMIGDEIIDLTPSPYGLGATTSGPLRVLRTEDDLDRSDLADSILVLTGDLAAEPLTPKKYPFYNSDDHARIVRKLEWSGAKAVVSVTGKYPALCGALDPFPLIEDGDFMIPVADVRPVDADPILDADGQKASLVIRSWRHVGRAANVVAVRGDAKGRITIIGHIDTKPGTPGAVDNAAGVVVLLLLADLLSPERHPTLPIGVELLVVNGEDHFAGPGEVAWLADQSESLEEIELAINIDGAGYRSGRSAWSTYNVDGPMAEHIATVFGDRTDMMSGPDWYQSDHAIFAMRGRPALAVTTECLDELLQHVFHSVDDTPDQVDDALVVGIADAIATLVTGWPG